MCVIMIVNKARPTEAMMQKAWGRNDDGAGIAYREKQKDGKILVRWKKGLDEKEMQHLCKTVPLPYVAHWRVASSGGVRADLTHPFPIDLKTTLALEGKTEGYVLFHNGTWQGWDAAALHAVPDAMRVAAELGHKNFGIPTGKWSDTRAIAWLMSVYGNGFMELLPTQKGVAFGPSGMDIFTGPGWSLVNEVWCSNDWFLNYSTSSSHTNGNLRPMCTYKGCAKQELDNDKRCSSHPKSSFPTNGYEGQASGVAKAQPTPFPQGQVLSLALAHMLFNQRNKDGKRRLSKNQLKDIKKLHLKAAGEGKKAEKAMTTLIQISAPLIPLCGLRR